MHYRKTAADHIEEVARFLLCGVWQNTFSKELVPENMASINLKANLVWGAMKA